MAVERGGRADKLGNRYEGLWVVQNLLQVLGGELVSVTVEAIGDDEKGVDLWVERVDGIREAEQCKRKNYLVGKWSMADLRRREVLLHLASQLQRESRNRFTFVSVHDAPELSKLAELARTSNNDPEAFFRTVDSSEALRPAFQTFCAACDLDRNNPAGLAAAYDLLQRSDVRVFDDSRGGRQDVELHARSLVTGDSRSVILLLAELAQDRMGTALHTDQIREHLRAHGHQPRDLAGEPNLPARIERLREEFRESLRPGLINGIVVHRTQTETVLGALRSESENRLLIVHGRAGAGKSGVLLEVTDQLHASGTPFLPLRLDRRTPQVSARQFGTGLCDLPDSPALSLRALAGSRDAVLVLDQLDAIRWTAAHGVASWEACQEVIDEAMALLRLRVVVACRTFDLRDDALIRSWLARHQAMEIEVGDLPDPIVEQIITQAGGAFRSFAKAQQNLLRSTLCLSLWTELARDGQPPTYFTTAAELMRAFWWMRRSQLEAMGFSGAEIDTALGQLTTWMDRNGSVHAPERLLDNHPKAKDAFLSLNLISIGEARVTFAHQTFFEYLFASRLLDAINSGRETIAGWLKRHDQSLFRREQVRQLLWLQRDEAPQDYLATVSGILADPDIRFHLKHLILRFIGDVLRPTPSEADCVLGLFRDPVWRAHIVEATLWGKDAWFTTMDERGIFRELLTSGSEQDQMTALQLMHLVAGSCGDRVAALLAPYEAEPDPWPRRVTSVLLFSDGSDDSGVLYELRLRLIARGVAPQPPMFPAKLLERDPHRCVQWLEARLQNAVRDWTAQVTEKPEDMEKERRFDLNIHEADTLYRLASAAPRAMWDRLLPCLLRLSELARHTSPDPVPGEFYPDSFWQHSTRRRRLLEPPDLVAALALAGAMLATDAPQFVVQQLSNLSGHGSRTVQQLLARVLTLCPGGVADLAINWLCDQPARFSLNDLGPGRWRYAQELIRQFASACSESVYARLEECVLAYHEPVEYRSLQNEQEAVEAGFSPLTDWYGLAQHALLPLLPQERLSPGARIVMIQWRGKFGFEAERFIRRRVGGSRSFVLPLSDQRARQMTDDEWLEIIRTHAQTLGIGHHIDLGEDYFTIHDANQYAQVLGLLARWQQRRCAELAMRLPPNANPQYVMAILHALWNREPPDPKKPGDWDPATSDQIVRLVEAIGYREERDLVLALCQVIHRWSDCNWPLPVLESLCRHATKHPDPGQGARPVPCADGTDLEASRLNCVRSVATEVIGAILVDHPELYNLFLPTMERIVGDPSPIVRVAAAGLCLPVLNHEPERAVELFLRVCETEDAVLACRAVSEFLSYALLRFPEKLEPLVRRMATSANGEAARLGAQWVTLDWLHRGGMDDLLHESALNGSANQRKGVAEVAAQSIADEQLLAGCVELLPLFFDDSDPQVREAVSAFLRQDRVLTKEQISKMAGAYVVSQAFRDDPADLLEALRRHDGSLVPFADVVFAVCHEFMGPLATGARDLREGLAYDVTLIPPLLLRLYEQAEQSGRRELQGRCLDSWDGLLRARLGGVRDLMAALDR